MTPAPRRKHKDGEESRQKILDAAAEIAGERGYEGTSIKLVSERSGLPASSIYWHFDDKDALIAAVIERSFNQWLADASSWNPPDEDAPLHDLVVEAMHQTAKAILDSPDFLRLGLMLTLERRPDEPTARTMFLEVRAEAHRRTVDTYTKLFPDIGPEGARQLATFTMAMADGLFIANEVDGDTVDLLGHFDALAAAIIAAAEHLAP